MNPGTLSKSFKQKKNRRRLLQALGFACLTTTAAVSAHAQTAYTWEGGTGNWSNGSMWGPMTAPNDPTADVYIDGGNTSVNSVVTMDNSYTVGRLTVDAGDTLNTNNGTTLTVSTGSFTGSGSIINNGTINLTGGYYNTELVFNGPGNLSGTGTLNLANGGSNVYVYENNGGDLLTVGAGFTVAGAGNFGDGQTTFANKGTINANSSGNTLTIQPGGGNATFTNIGAGIAEASGGGILQLAGNNGGVFTGGTFQALDNSQVNLINSPNISGAILTTAGSGTINNLNSATLTNVTNNGVFNTNNGNTTYLSGTLTNNGTLNVIGGYYNTTVQLTGPVTLAGTGTLSLAGGGSNVFVYADNGGNQLTINAGATIAGAGNLGDGQTTFLNNGLVNANSSGNTLTIQPGGGNATFSNGTTGLAEASGGGILQLAGSNGGVFTGGTFQALDGSSLVLTNNPNVSSAILTTAGSGTVTNTNSATLTNVTNNGAFTANNGTNTYLAGTLTNNGTVTLTGGYYSTSAQLAGPVTLAGTGTLTMGGAGSNLYVYAQNSGDRLTINSGATIAGAGNLGDGQTTFTNNGTVSANSSGNTLVIQPGGTTASGTDFTNSGAGIAEATGGGILQLAGNNGGVFTGGTFQALDGSSLVLTNNPNVSSAILTTAGSGTVTNTNSATLTNVTNNGAFIANNGTNTYLTGTFTNNGTVTLTGGYYETTVQLTGPVTLAGTGAVTLANGGSNLYVYAQNAGDRLTIGAAQTIAGAGNLGDGQTTFTNNGTVNANSSGNTLTIQPGGSTADFTNSGAGFAEASGGGILQLAGNNGGVFTGGTFQALDGSAVTITGGANVSAATLTTAGSGTVTVENSTLTNVTNNGTLVGPNSDSTTLVGTLTNNGTFTANGGYYDTYVLLNGSVTLAGTGTLSLAGSGSNLYVYAQNSGDRLTINAGATIAGAGNLGDGQTTFTNNGTVNANTSGSTLTIQPGGGTADFTNGATGLAEATAGGTLAFSNANGGTFTNNGTVAVISGNTGGSSSLSIPAGALTNFSGTTLTGGTYNVLATDSSATSTLSIGGGTITTNAANVTLSGANSVFNEIGGITSNQGSFAVANGRTFTTVGALANSGTLIASGGSTLTVAGNFNQSPAAVLEGDGGFSAPMLTISGTVAPGGSISATTGAFTGGVGTLTLTGTTVLNSDASLAFELGMPGANTSDHLDVMGAFTLGGKLDVTGLSGFGAGLYDLIDYSNILAFTNNGLTLGSVPAGYNYIILTAVPGQVDLLVTNAVPEPSTWAFVLGGATLLVGAQRQRRNARRGVHQ